MMNLSANEGTFRRFTFDQVFACEKELRRREDCTYREEDLQAAKMASYTQGEQAGYLRGRQEAEQSLQRQCADALSHQIQELILSQARLEENAHQGVAQLALQLLQTLMPAYAEQGALQEVTQMITEAFQTTEATKMTLFVHPDLKSSLEQNLESLKSTVERDVQLSIQSSARLGEDFELSDCRIEWQGGGLERRQARLKEEMEKALSRLQNHQNEEMNSSPVTTA